MVVTGSERLLWAVQILEWIATGSVGVIVASSLRISPSYLVNELDRTFARRRLRLIFGLILMALAFALCCVSLVVGMSTPPSSPFGHEVLQIFLALASVAASQLFLVVLLPYIADGMRPELAPSSVDMLDTVYFLAAFLMIGGLAVLFLIQDSSGVVLTVMGSLVYWGACVDLAMRVIHAENDAKRRQSTSSES